MNDFTPVSVRMYQAVVVYLKLALSLIGLVIVFTIGLVYWFSRWCLPPLILVAIVGLMMGWWRLP